MENFPEKSVEFLSGTGTVVREFFMAGNLYVHLFCPEPGPDLISKIFPDFS
jgi:hypothetical protein